MVCPRVLSDSCQSQWTVLQASSDGLGRGLDAVATATVIIGLLQQHHVKVIQPHVTQSPSEWNACSTGLASLIRSVEERVLASMQAILNAFFAQVHSRTCLACLHPCKPSTSMLPVQI